MAPHAVTKHSHGIDTEVCTQKSIGQIKGSFTCPVSGSNLALSLASFDNIAIFLVNHQT